MALGLRQPKAQGGRTSRVGDSDLETLGRACCFAMYDGGAALPTSCNHAIKVYKQCGLLCIKGVKHRASPVLFALVRGCLHNCAATSVSPAPLLNGSATARGQASWPSAAGGGSAIHWWHSLPWCPGTLSGGVGCRDGRPAVCCSDGKPQRFSRHVSVIEYKKTEEEAVRGG